MRERNQIWKSQRKHWLVLYRSSRRRQTTGVGRFDRTINFSRENQISSQKLPVVARQLQFFLQNKSNFFKENPIYCQKKPVLARKNNLMTNSASETPNFICEIKKIKISEIRIQWLTDKSNFCQKNRICSKQLKILDRKFRSLPEKSMLLQNAAFETQNPFFSNKLIFICRKTNCADKSNFRQKQIVLKERPMSWQKKPVFARQINVLTKISSWHTKWNS